MVSVPPDVVPGQPRDVWARDTAAPRDSGSALSISDVRLEGGGTSLGTPSRLGPGSGRSPTPTWTEGTPSYTESTYSGDTAGRATPFCLPASLQSSVLVIRVLPSEVPERHNLGPRVEQFLVSVLHFISGSAFPATPSRSQPTSVQDGAEETGRVCQETEMVSSPACSDQSVSCPVVFGAI